MRTEILTPPVAEPLLLAEVKDHLRLGGADEDAALGALIAASRDMVEGYLGLALIGRTVSLYLDAWPGSEGGMPWWQGVAAGSLAAFAGMTRFLPFPVRPVSAITEVATMNAGGGWTVWDSTNYTLKPGLEAGLYRLAGGWPMPARGLDGIRITLTVGYGESWNDVPAAIRQALLLLVAHLYANRGDTPVKAMADSGASATLAPYMRKRL